MTKKQPLHRIKAILKNDGCPPKKSSSAIMEAKLREVLTNLEINSINTVLPPMHRRMHMNDLFFDALTTILYEWKYSNLDDTQ